MYPFPPTVTPALREHVDAQTAYLNDISKSVFRSFQQMVDLNIQLAQTLLEESTLASKQVLSTDRQSELASAATARVQPTSDKVRAYQQHITRLVADTQADLARVSEQHVQTTTHTARALADAVSRDATEQTERGLRTQQEAIHKFADPFAHSSNGEDRSQQRSNDRIHENGTGGQPYSQPGQGQDQHSSGAAH
jgi:phasin family protein